jgi:hypothetical protein
MNKAEWDKLLEAEASWLAAKDGDTRALERRLKSGQATAKERALEAELAAGRIKRAAHRPQQLRVEMRKDLCKRFLKLAIPALGPRVGRSRRIQPDGRAWQMKDVVAEARRLYGPLQRSDVYELIDEIQR